MIKKVKKGQRLWVINITDNMIEIGTALKSIHRTTDKNHTIDIEIDAHNIAHAEPEDVFFERKEAVGELIVRLTEKHDHIEEKLLFLNKELNKKGKKVIILPTHLYKFRFQARTMF